MALISKRVLLAKDKVSRTFIFWQIKAMDLLKGKVRSIYFRYSPAAFAVSVLRGVAVSGILIILLPPGPVQFGSLCR